jgi:tRNA 2-thiouridine synthesizing protein A
VIFVLGGETSRVVLLSYWKDGSVRRGELGDELMSLNLLAEKIAARLDLRGVKCPINFVKIKLQLEELEKGDILEVHVDDGEPMRNVPRSVKEEGHKIIKADKLENSFRLYVQKGGGGPDGR